MKLKVVIIEDEPANVRNLEYLLKDISVDISIMHVLGSVKDAINWLPNNLEAIDLLFMDIRLTDGISFEILKKVEVSKPIIFATAYEEYALEAFNTHGIAYILKPYDKADIESALAKFASLTTASITNEFLSQDVLKQVLSQLQPEQSYKKSFLVHYQNKLVPVATDSIVWFYSKNEIVKACTKTGKQYVIEDTLEHIYTLLQPTDFFRANRQFILHRDSIDSIDFYFNGRLLVKTTPTTEEQIIISKAKASIFKSWLDS
ncbi:LytR/AlgR family response regulator transcription factor [Neptunitalea lumnitzerae]|uniref:DNA-binding response regulator n=1 Tax=Neptunitalea lumnitzerae TaxID=2965509 RepID=A0ABQ5MLN2_9FLAO|nr:LytTR family DNA-binding domain-containing protein [Neptunitalea sp. Y10]GLB50284.1 DNA-binding response regulator [Neptunitalea sp. Y10]